MGRASLQSGIDGRANWPLVAAVSVPPAVLSIDLSGVVVALPMIGEDFGVSAAALTWVISAFALGSSAPLIVSGRWSDVAGRRPLLLGGLWVFTAATLVCAAAPEFWVLILGRLAQGVGMALFMAASLAALVAGTKEPFRTRAVGVWSAVAGLALAVGPLIGGILTSLGTWRWFFVADLPVLVVGLVLVHRYVHDGRRVRSAPIDAAAAVAITVAVAAGTAAIQSLAVPGRDVDTLVAVVVAVVAGAVFVARERRVLVPIVAVAIRRARNFWLPVTVAWIANWGFGALQFLLTLQLQDVYGWSALETGLAFLLYSVPFAVVGFTIGRITGRLGRTGPLVAGMSAIAASFGVIAVLAGESGVGAALVALAVAGVGQGLAFNITTVSSLGAVDDADAGVGSGILTTVRGVGIVCGVTLTSVVAGEVAGGLPSDVDAGTALAAPAAAAFTDGLRLAAAALALVSLAGAAVATRVRDRPDTP